ASGPALSGCAQEGPAPYAEMVLRVDTNLPVPLVSRLRVDLYTEAGAWFDSRDIARPDPRDWPASFSLFSTDEAARSRVWARLRVYPEAGVRDYQGERFSDWGASLEPPRGDGLPRLLVDGRDITPALEPLPLLSVDR